MEKLIITGQRPLRGKVAISGSKNAAVALIAAALLAEDEVILENVPDIADIQNLIKIMEELQVKVRKLDRNTLCIDARGMVNCCLDSEPVHKMRASYYMLGVLLGRFRHARVGFPGGCDFGSRPLDYHVKGFESLGAQVKSERIIEARAETLTGSHIYLDFPSVGATINIMLAAVLAGGTTVIENAAREPHVVDTANLLGAMGANVKGAGTSTIRIRGVAKLHGCRYSVLCDQIEAGTYMIAAAITGGDITVTNVIPRHLESISAKLREIGVAVIDQDDSVRILGGGVLHPIKVKTQPYPGFPTDMQPQMMTLLSTIPGVSVVTETIFDNRFRYVEQLLRLGANIEVSGQNAIIQGGTPLHGAEVSATDLRGGVAMVLAGLAAVGRTTLTNIHFIDRGYEDMVKKLTELGAQIKRTK